MRIADQTDLALIPVYDYKSADTFNMSVYYIDLSSSGPEFISVTKEEIKINYRKRPHPILNADGDGFYIKHLDGTMIYFDLKD